MQQLTIQKENKIIDWQKLHKIIDANKKHDKMNKKADKWLVYHWEEFKQVKGKTFGDVKRNTRNQINVEPSILAICYRHDENGAEEYIKSKYGGK